MQRLRKYLAVAFLILILAIQFVRPLRTNPATDPEATLFAQVEVPRDVAAVLQRGCRDCHSNDTRWPWYSQVAPVSWFVIDHVNHGRSHFNYSRWVTYTPAQVAKLLEGTCELSRKGAMPMPSYLWMHGNARLSGADVDRLCGWTEDMARQLAKGRGAAAID